MEHYKTERNITQQHTRKKENKQKGTTPRKEKKKHKIVSRVCDEPTKYEIHARPISVIS